MSETTNRFVLVDETGRVYDRTGVSVELSEQDDGLTLKVFVKPTTESAEAKARHLKRLADELDRVTKFSIAEVDRQILHGTRDNLT